MNIFKKIVFLIVVMLVSNCAMADTEHGNNVSPQVSESKRVWMSLACYKWNLGVWDKLMNGPYPAKYVVKAGDGRTFIAEKHGDDDANTAQVVFPDDFHDEKTNLKAWINCQYGENYTWAIYANDALIDSGAIAFSRNKKQK